MNPKSRQERLVFVDPEDEEISYWWPAIVVTEDEYELFKETMTNEEEASFSVGELERLVCYFEDGSFSVVPKSGLIPFNPSREPFKSYSMRLKHFSSDSGVKSAVAFHQHGVIPKIFKWLILSETGYLDSIGDDKREEEEEEENINKETESIDKFQFHLKKKKLKSTSKDNLQIENEGIKYNYNIKDKYNYNIKDKYKENDKDKDDTSSSQVISKTKPKTKTKHKLPIEEKNRRGRKPKPRPELELEFNETKPKSKTKNEIEINLLINHNNDNHNSNELIPSPTPINPAEMNKIEALLSAAAMVSNVQF